MRPERLELRLERPILRPDGPDFKPERPDLRLERPVLRPERPLGGDRQTDKGTDGRTKVPLCSTGLYPLQGRCPKRVSLKTRSFSSIKK